MRTVKIVDIAEQIRGVSYNPEDVFDTAQENTVPLLRANNIQDTGLNYDDLVYVQKSKVSPKQLLRQGDILVCASSGSRHLVGKAGHVYNDFGTFGAFCKVLRPNAQLVNSNYFAHYFQSPLYRRTIANLAAGANINNIKNEHLNELQIKLPCLQEQNIIARVLDKTNAIIGKRRAPLSCLNELAKSRFIEMFGDVSCNDKGWKIAKMSEISTSRLGKMLDAKKQTGQCSFPYLANINVRWFGFDFSSLRQMDFNEADQQEFSLLKGDLLVCEGGEVGRCAVWDNEISPCFYQKALHRIRCDFKKILPEYLAWWFKCNCDKEAFENVAGAKATIAHLPGVKLKNLNVATPPISLQQDFVTFLRELDKSKFSVSRQQKMIDSCQRGIILHLTGRL